MAQKTISQVYSKIEEIELQINNLLLKVKETNSSIEELVQKGSVATTELDAASAKIIFEITKIISEKINDCPCNKDILDAVKNISITNTVSTSNEDRKGYKGLIKFSPPSKPNTKTFEKKILTMGDLGNKE